MSAPLFLLDPARWGDPRVGGQVTLDGPEGRHAVAVRRTCVGEQLRLADGAGRWALVEVIAVGKDTLTGVIVDLGAVPAPRPAYLLVQALAKDGRDERAVEMATELGADAILPWQAARSVVQWRGERAEKSRAKWESVVTAATKQSRRVWRPRVEPVATGSALLSRLRDCAAVLVLHEAAETPIGAIDIPVRGEVAVVVGPEGGISPEELSVLSGIGAVMVRLGPHVLRSSTAGPAAIAILAARHRWT